MPTSPPACSGSCCRDPSISGAEAGRRGARLHRFALCARVICAGGTPTPGATSRRASSGFCSSSNSRTLIPCRRQLLFLLALSDPAETRWEHVVPVPASFSLLAIRSSRIPSISGCADVEVYRRACDLFESQRRWDSL